MGNFFLSPREREATSMYEAAKAGHPLGEGLLNRGYDQARTQLRQTTSDRVTQATGDIMSRMASINAPGSATEGVISKATAPIVASGQNAELGLDANQLQALTNLMIQQLSAGLSGLSNSSSFSDVMAGLTTVANIGAGVTGMGKNLGWWNKPMLPGGSSMNPVGNIDSSWSNTGANLI